MTSVFIWFILPLTAWQEMKVAGTVILLLVILVFPSNAFADLSFTVDQTIIHADQEIIVHASLELQGQSNKQYFLEGAFKKQDGSNYFGLTWNDTDWVKYSGSSFSNLKSITTDENGKWSGDIKLKLDSASNLFSGNGNYILQLKRFTTGGSSTPSETSVNLTVEGSSSPTSSPSSSAQPTPTNNASSQGSINSQTFSINLNTSSLDVNQSTPVHINIVAQPVTRYFIKGAFFKDGSTNYFGKTQVGENWVKNSDKYDQQVSITTGADGSWQGDIKIMPDADDSGFTGAGSYSFKVGRYNSSGGSLTWSNQTAINLTGEKPQPSSSSAGSSDSSSESNSTDDTASEIVTAGESTNTDLAGTFAEGIKDYQIASVAGEATVAALIKDQPIIEESLGSPLKNNWIIAGGIFLTIGSVLLVKLLQKKV